MIALAAGDLSAAEAAAAGALDALCAEAGGTLDSLLYRAAEGNSLFELSRDVLRDELCVQIGAADLNDVEGNGLAELLLDGLAQLLDVFATLADDDTGAGAVNVDLDLRVISFDLDLGDTGGIEGALEILEDVVVLNDQITDFILTGIQARVPFLN